jgi:uncharacterized membrane protein (DUF2068 family)
MRPYKSATGLRLIVGYKIVKAALELSFGVLLLIVGPAGLVQDVRGVALHFQHHATAAWSTALAERLVHATTEQHVLVVAVASLVDGVWSALEGWALHRRYPWARWLVVAATSSALPFEVVALVRHLSELRSALLLVNAGIVLYLALGKIGIAPRDEPDL